MWTESSQEKNPYETWKDAQLSMVIGFSQQLNEVNILIIPILQIRKPSQKRWSILPECKLLISNGARIWTQSGWLQVKE